jgi:hypothetical protein
VEGVDAGNIPAQGNPQETGELLPDPNLLLEPEVEIGDYSPVFSSDYELQGENGRVNLKWTHIPGHPLSFRYVPDGGTPECSEFARMKQEFTWEYNQTPITLKVSASIQITRTGDFAIQENGEDMYSIYFWIGVPGYTNAYRIKMIEDLIDGQTYDIEFLLTHYEAQAIFAGSYPHDTYAMFVGLIPSFSFLGTFGGINLWEVYDGSVTATIDHFSVNGLLEVDDLVPEKISPQFNTTTLWNDTYRGLRIESLGQASFVHVSQNTGVYPYNQISLGKITSEHSPIWNVTSSFSESNIAQVMDMKVVENNVFLAGMNQSADGVNILLMKFDSQGQENWRNAVSIFGFDIPLFIDVASTGTIFILTMSLRNYFGLDPFQNEIIYSLVSFDSQGNRRWNITILALSYEEYAYSINNQQLPKGLDCYGDDVYIGMTDAILRYDSNGNEIWRRSYEFGAFVGDPYGGFYTASSSHDDKMQLSKWNIAGTIVWNRSMSFDYGLEWQDYPLLQKMKVGQDGFLYLVLDYTHIDPVITISKVSPSGQLYSQDTISLYLSNQWYYVRPLVCDIAITSDGLVHLAVLSNYGSPSYPYNPLLSLPADTLLTFELSESLVFTMSPASLIIIGVATLMFGGIAWDHFIRGRTRPEEILPEQEDIDPWKMLMGDTEDE